MSPAPLIIHADAESLAEAAAQRLMALAELAIAARGRCHIALSGGSTPRRLYQLLAAPAARERVDWTRMEFWFGDERCVPPSHADSNYRMAREALFDHVPLPAANIHRLDADIRYVRQDACRYAEQLHRHLPIVEGMPCFDIILLGMGADGHTASLFPGSCILHETARPVAATYVDKLKAWRISLTYPVLNQGRHLLMLIAGADKAQRIGEIHGAAANVIYPIQRIQARGEVEWHLDCAAAAELPEGKPS